MRQSASSERVYAHSCPALDARPWGQTSGNCTCRVVVPGQRNSRRVLLHPCAGRFAFGPLQTYGAPRVSLRRRATSEWRPGPVWSKPVAGPAPHPPKLTVIIDPLMGGGEWGYGISRNKKQYKNKFLIRAGVRRVAAPLEADIARGPDGEGRLSAMRHKQLFDQRTDRWEKCLSS